MSVLIKDMEMPKSCYECKLDIRTDVCLAFSEWNKEHPYSIRATDRLPDCPLSEVPERKKGKWIDDCECSSCHWINEDDEGHVLLTYYNFCPNCGEPMENGEKDEQF